MGRSSFLDIFPVDFFFTEIRFWEFVQKTFSIAQCLVLSVMKPIGAVEVCSWAFPGIFHGYQFQGILSSTETCSMGLMCGTWSTSFSGQQRGVVYRQKKGGGRKRTVSAQCEVRLKMATAEPA